MTIIIENNIAGHTFILIPQEDGPNDIIGCKFIPLAQKYGHKFWVCIVTMNNDQGTKVTHYPGHMHIICSINDYQYEGVMPCNKITNHIVHKGDEAIFWKLKHIVSYEGLNIKSHGNGQKSWYDVMVEWGTGETTT